MSDINKPEVLGLIIRFGLISIISYVTVKWIVKQIDPTNKQKKLASIKALDLLKKLGVKDIKKLSDYEMVIASHLVDPESISVTWDSIAGLEQIIQELKETVILPIKRKDLFANSLLTRAPKGVLLYGPPGCGKTMMAKATAKEAGTRFINLDVSILTDKWYGESQKLASAVFSLALKLQPCIIFIDEIDSFLRKRNSQDHEATAMMKAQFMSLWDGLITDPNCTVILMGATNRQQDLDRAILRRMPATFHVPLPNTSQRKQILELILRDEPTSADVDINELADKTLGFSGSDLRELCRNASVYRVRDYMRTSSKPDVDAPNCSASSYYSTATLSSSSSSSSSTEVQDSLRAITMDDLVTTYNKMRESKLECGDDEVFNFFTER